MERGTAQKRGDMMPRIETIKKARASKNLRRCACGHEIAVGDSYRKAERRYGPTVIRCEPPKGPRCRFRPSDLSGAKYAVILDSIEDAQDEITNWDGDETSDLEATLESVADEAESVANEYEESGDNIEEHFQGSEQAENLKGYAEELHEWAGTIRDTDFDERDEPGEVECPECDGGGEIEPEAEDDETCPDCEGSGDSKADMARPCERCGGSGNLNAEPEKEQCSNCDGTGQVPAEVDWDAKQEWADAQRDKAATALEDMPDPSF